MKKLTYRITAGALLLAAAVILPQLLHLTGGAALGSVFLPMHLPVLLGGFLLGPLYAALLGATAPALSCLLTGMPAAARLPFMMAELAVYGALTGLFYHRLGLSRCRFGTELSLLIALIAGRLVYMGVLALCAHLLGIAAAQPLAVLSSAVTGLPGIVIQLALVPTCIRLCRRHGIGI